MSEVSSTWVTFPCGRSNLTASVMPIVSQWATIMTILLVYHLIIYYVSEFRTGVGHMAPLFGCDSWPLPFALQSNTFSGSAHISQAWCSPWQSLWAFPTSLLTRERMFIMQKLYCTVWGYFLFSACNLKCSVNNLGIYRRAQWYAALHFFTFTHCFPLDFLPSKNILILIFCFWFFYFPPLSFEFVFLPSCSCFHQYWWFIKHLTSSGFHYSVAFLFSFPTPFVFLLSTALFFVSIPFLPPPLPS